MKTGIELITKERKKQLGKWDLEHDNFHPYGELAAVAAALCCHGIDCNIESQISFIENGKDEWGLVERHQNDRIKQLQIAGALCAAEIDRIQNLKTNHVKP